MPDADETELMKMAVRMPDTLKTEREEIDENDWIEIQTVIKEALQNIAIFEKTKAHLWKKNFNCALAIFVNI